MKDLLKLHTMIKSPKVSLSRFFALILLGLCLAFTACDDCSQFSDEEYTELDTMTLHHPLLRFVKEQYAEMGELDLPVPDDQVYRMYYGHAFEECKYAIRISKLENACAIHCSYMDWIPVDSSWKTIVVEWADKRMSLNDWYYFESLMTQSHFWTSPQRVNRQGFDGYGIVLEGYRPGAGACNRRVYHLIHRWSPEEVPLREAVDLLLKYAEIPDLPYGR